MMGNSRLILIKEFILSTITQCICLIITVYIKLSNLIKINS